MRRAMGLGLTIVALLGAVAGRAARADDAPIAPAHNAPMMAIAAPYNWSGFYLGGNLGGGWGRSNANVVFDKPSHAGVIETSVGSASQNMDSVLGGVQAGYNFQTNSMVFGLETDFQFTGQKGDARLPDTIIIPSICIAPCVPGPPTVKTGTLDYAQKLPWFGTLRARVGVTPWDNWLLYATGGLAYSEIGTDASFTLPGAGICVAPCTPGPAGSAASFNQMKAGWVLGGGVETKLGGGWSGKLEYLHVDFGGVSNSFASAINPFVGTFRASSRVTDDILRVGLNYRFSDLFAR